MVQALEAAVPNVAVEDKLGPLVRQVITANLASQVPLETPEMLEDHPSPLVNKLPHHHVILVRLDHRDQTEAQARPEMPALTATLDKEVATRNRDRLVQKVHLGNLEPLEMLEALDRLEHPLNLKTPDKDNQDLLETLDPLDPPARAEAPDSPEDQEPQDLKDQMDSPVPQEMTDNPATQEKLVNQEDLEKKESVRNTAPSMAESSSRMEHEDVKSRPAKIRTRGDLPKIPCPMNQHFLLLVAQKTAIYYVSLLYCIQDLGSFLLGSTFHFSFFLK